MTRREAQTIVFCRGHCPLDGSGADSAQELPTGRGLVPGSPA